MKVKRVISCYSTINDELIDEINIDNIPVLLMSLIFLYRAKLN